MSRNVYVIGVGMIPFVKPGANAPYPQMAAAALRAAMVDAGVGYAQVPSSADRLFSSGSRRRGLTPGCKRPWPNAWPSS